MMLNKYDREAWRPGLSQWCYGLKHGLGTSIDWWDQGVPTRWDRLRFYFPREQGVEWVTQPGGRGGEAKILIPTFCARARLERQSDKTFFSLFQRQIIIRWS